MGLGEIVVMFMTLKGSAAAVLTVVDVRVGLPEIRRWD